jgi:hypothetical protein
VFQSPHKKGHLDIAKIKIDAKDEDWFLNVSIVRYRSLSDINIELARIKDPRRKDQLEKALKKPYYRFEGTTSTYTFRRHLPSDGELDINSTYVECGKTNEKASLPSNILDQNPIYINIKKGQPLVVTLNNRRE